MVLFFCKLQGHSQCELPSISFNETVSVFLCIQSASVYGQVIVFVQICSVRVDAFTTILVYCSSVTVFPQIKILCFCCVLLKTLQTHWFVSFHYRVDTRGEGFGVVVL